MTEFPAPSLLETAHLLRRSLSDFGRRMRSLRDDHEISASKLSVLGRLLRASRTLSATELAALERLQPQSLTRIIAELDEDGLIVRTRNATDRRQIDIAISDRGRTLIQRDALRQSHWLAEAMERHLTPAERSILALAAELLDRISDSPEEPARTDAVEETDI